MWSDAINQCAAIESAFYARINGMANSGLRPRPPTACVHKIMQGTKLMLGKGRQAEKNERKRWGAR
jgi:hypothetical protein